MSYKISDTPHVGFYYEQRNPSMKQRVYLGSLLREITSIGKLSDNFLDLFVFLFIYRLLIRRVMVVVRVVRSQTI